MNRPPPTSPTPSRVVIATGYDLILRHLVGALTTAGHEVVGIVTVSGAPPVIQAAKALGCPCFALPMLPGEMNVPRGMRKDPAYAEAVRASVEGLAALDADFLVGWAINVLPGFVLDSARHAINVHPSDLPRYRGGFPLEAQILDGSRRLYVSVHETTRRIDAGRVLSRSEALKIKRSDTMTSLLNRTLPVGAALAAGTLTRWDRLAPVPPPAVDRAVADAWGIRRVRNADGTVRNEGVLGRLRVEWALDTADDIARSARAFDMIGGAYTNLGEWMFRITRARIVERTVSAPPGTVLAQGDALDVQALDAVVRLEGAFTESEARVVPGDRFVSTIPISKLLQFEGAERVPNPVEPRTPTEGPVFKILTRAQWEERKDAVPWAPVDHSDGFLHLSTADQLERTLTLHFAGQRDLVVLTLDPARIPDLRWEESRGGALFPHAYGTTPLEAVRSVETRP